MCIADTDARTALPTLANERFAMVSLLTHDQGINTHVAVATGRVFDSVQTALGCVILNGHKLGYHMAFADTLKAPPGPFIAPLVTIYSGALLGTWALNGQGGLGD